MKKRLLFLVLLPLMLCAQEQMDTYQGGSCGGAVWVSFDKEKMICVQNLKNLLHFSSKYGII